MNQNLSNVSNNNLGAKIWLLIKNFVFKEVYPIGSIYISLDSKNPSSLFGGTWERIEDRFLLAAGNNYSVGSTGGEAEHKLTFDEMPSHEGHLYGNEASFVPNGPDSYYMDFYHNNGLFQKYDNRPYILKANNEIILKGFSRGGTEPHNNMPPYLSVYMWKRVA